MLKKMSQKQGAEENKSFCASIQLNRKGKFMSYWDLMVSSLLFYVTLATPFEVAFVNELNPTRFLWWSNLFVDLNFFADLVFNFLTPFDEPVTNKTIHSTSRIAKRYLMGWFTIDLVSIFPFSSLGASGFMSNLKMLKILRLLKLMKLLRLVRGLRIFKRWEAQLGINHGILKLICFGVLILVCAHWMACMWGMVAGNMLASTRYNWKHGYGVSEASELTQYCSSLYWATMTLSTIGYGDVVATSNPERVLAIVAMFIGGSIYAYVVGGIFDVIKTMSVSESDYELAVDRLNRYMKDTDVSHSVCVEARNYLGTAKGPLFEEKYNQEVAEMMSPGLHGEFCTFAYGSIIEEVSVFKLAFKDSHLDKVHLFVANIARYLRWQAFPPHEQFISYGEHCNEMYILQKGLVGANMRIHSPGSCIGEDIVCKDARRRYSATSLTSVQCMTLNRADLHFVLGMADYRHEVDRIKNRALGYAFTYTFWELARRIRRARKLFGEYGHIFDITLDQAFPGPGALYEVPDIDEFTGRELLRKYQRQRKLRPPVPEESSEEEEEEFALPVMEDKNDKVKGWEEMHESECKCLFCDFAADMIDSMEKWDPQTGHDKVKSVKRPQSAKYKKHRLSVQSAEYLVPWDKQKHHLAPKQFEQLMAMLSAPPLSAITAEQKARMANISRRFSVADNGLLMAALRYSKWHGGKAMGLLRRYSQITTNISVDKSDPTLTDEERQEDLIAMRQAGVAAKVLTSLCATCALKSSIAASLVQVERRMYQDKVFAKLMLEAVLAHRARLTAQLMRAVKQDEVERVVALRMEGADLFAVDDDGMTAMHFAASTGKIRMCKWLWDLPERKRKGRPTSAVPGRSTPKPKPLRLDAETKNFWSPMHFASHGGHLKVVKWLFLALTEMDLPFCAGRTRMGQNALDVAKSAKHTEVVDFIEARLESQF